MIRRLHLEEVQPPVPTVAAASELSKSGDDEERRSLALEFKNLLSKVVGQVGSLTDEGTALAMALAQAMPTQRVVHQDLQKSETSDISRENSDQDLLDDSGAENQQFAVGADESDADDSGSRGAQTIDREANGSGDNSGRAIGLASSEVTTQVETSVEMVTLNTLSALGAQGTEGDDVGVMDIAESLQSAPAASQAQQVVSSADTTGGASADVAGQIQVLAAEDEAVRVQVQDNANDEGDIELGADLATSATSVDSSGEANILRRVATAQKNQENGDFSQSLSQQSDAKVEDQFHPATSSRETLSNQSAGSEPLPEAVTRKRVEDGVRGAQSARELSSMEPEVISPSVSQPSRRGTEGVVQMTILRQAFESLRAARQESAEGQAKPATPTVSGAAAAAPKRSEDAASSKGSRGMNKGQMARMLERVQSTLTEAAKARDGKTISLRLDPANLGRVKVDVSLKEGTLHARITPENQQVMTALREHAHELQGALRKLGLDVDSVTVTVRSDGFQEEAASGQNSFDGSTFQQERNNMPHERSQVVENTVGNELAQWKEAVAPEQGVGVVDHWVA
jgi:flagellar hook-length control protein FliK